MLNSFLRLIVSIAKFFVSLIIACFLWMGVMLIFVTISQILNDYSFSRNIICISGMFISSLIALGFWIDLYLLD